MVVWVGPGPRRRVRNEARQALQLSKAERMVLEEAPFRSDAVLDGLGHVVAHRARQKGLGIRIKPALVLAAAHRDALILMDMQMPRLNALDATVRTQAHPIAVVVDASRPRPVGQAASSYRTRPNLLQHIDQLRHPRWWEDTQRPL
jgi:CheY-like chemotaxis protein